MQYQSCAIAVICWRVLPHIGYSGDPENCFGGDIDRRYVTVDGVECVRELGPFIRNFTPFYEWKMTARENLYFIIM